MHFKIVVFGVKEVSELLINYLIERDIKIDLIVSIDKSVLTKNHISGYKNLENVANKNSIQYFAVQNYSFENNDDLNFFLCNDFDLGICHPWQRLIPKQVLDRFSFGIFGFHGSSFYLPKGKGRSPLNWSIIEGKKTIHNNLFRYVPTPDAGSIYSVSDFEINEHDTIRTLEYKQLFDVKIQTLKLIKDYKENDITLNSQEGESTYYPKRSPEDGKIDFNKTTKEIYNLIRGVSQPFPGAFCYNNGEKVLIWDAKPFDQTIDFSEYKKGEVIDTSYDLPVIKTIDGSIIVHNYESKKALKMGNVLA